MIISNMATAPQRKPRVVIVGGGFAGVRAAKRLAAKSNAVVSLISGKDFFAYYPQLYHSATGGARTESAIPLTDMLGGSGVQIIKDTIVGLEPDAKTVTGT